MSDQLANKGLVAQDQRAVSGTSLGFAEHPQRSFILGELHARPFLPVKLPRRSYHFAFMTDSSQAAEDRAAVMALAEQRGPEAAPAYSPAFGGVADPAAAAAWGTVPPFRPAGVIVLADATAIERLADDRYVGGDIGPSGEMMPPLGKLTYEAAVEIFAEQAAALAAGGADVLAALPSIAEATGFFELTVNDDLTITIPDRLFDREQLERLRRPDRRLQTSVCPGRRALPATHRPRRRIDSRIHLTAPSRAPRRGAVGHTSPPRTGDCPRPDRPRLRRRCWQSASAAWSAD